ncbi:hypothetical protein [Candidatus Uabimicrobium sp. HlEnr_7]|uniref:hypothetical protein n=1 Tax=Candidatus Uabimicrobium helgolandensis TaxID=3095367 RepID=UPI003558F27B
MRIAIDINHTITHAPEFFSLFTRLMKAEIIIVTCRDSLEEAQLALQDCQVRYDRIIIPNDSELGRKKDQNLSEWKAHVIEQIKADVFFDDTPEIIALIKPPTKVFMVIDEVMQGWIQDNLSRS